MDVKQLENFQLSMYDVQHQLKRHVYERSLQAFRMGDEARDLITSKEQLEERQIYMRTKFTEAVGGLPASDTPLNATVTGVVRCDGFSIEKIIYESRPDTYVTCNLYVPDGITAPQGAVLYLSGHHEQAKHHPEYQTVCQHLVKSGLIVLAIDPIGQGERLSYYEQALDGPTIRSCTGEHDYAGSQCWPLGDGLARYFVHDGMRGIDYLCTRPEVDSDKIGVTGNSGGGTQTSLMMVCDPRIAAAAPATFIMNRRTYLFAGGAQDAEQIWPGMSALGFDHEDILLAVAPKPVRVLSVQYDFFPIEGTRTTVARTKRFWEMYGAGNDIDLIEDASVHRYTEALAQAAAEFFSRHLLDETGSAASSEIKTLPPSQLWCTETGQVRNHFNNARAVHEENAERLRELEQERYSVSLDVLRQRAMVWLKDRIWNERTPCDFNPRHVPIGWVDDLTVTSSLWWSQEGIFNHGFLFRSFLYQNEELPLTIAVWDEGTDEIQRHLQWIRETCESGRAVLVLDTSGAGKLTPNPLNGHDARSFYGVIHKLSDDLIWLNDSLAAMRTYDVLRAIEFSAQIPGIMAEDIRLYAHGRQGMYAQLASLLDGKIKAIDVAQGMGSMKSWIGARHYDSHDIMSIVLPGMLKYFDLPDLGFKR